MLALLCLTTQLSIFAHLALVPHATCLEHGELVDAASLPPLPLTAASDEDSAIAALPLATVTAHAHDHCILSALRRLPAQLQREAEPNQARACSEPSAPPRVDQLLPQIIALLDLAPKSSPPAA